MEWYFSIGLVLWILAQITRADETSGIKNNILCLLIFIVAWPKIVAGLAPIFPYTFYHLTHYWFAAADIPVANDTPV
ncbi:hypothetical protein, partial [Klebsiella pneumoniae]|uniref:hypothetical protein n=1 Tax=Klebsiella pneumoniae TaxID=573 RepID=UPI001159BE15